MAGYRDRDVTSQARSQSRKKAAENEIGPLPEPLHKELRDKCKTDLKLFCETYLDGMFYLDWSDIHLEVIQKLEDTVINGNQLCVALPRGSGKTSLCEAAIVWALVYGHRKFVVLIASNAVRAKQILKEICCLISDNDKLCDDFPESILPIKELSGRFQKARYQTVDGNPTNIELRADALVLPSVDGSCASGSRLFAAGLTGSSLRGLSAVAPDGSKRRPDLVLLDDCQDRESAVSQEQTATRERIIQSDVRGLAGPGKKIAMMCTITVIAQDDLAQRLLDHDKHPEWRGIRYPLMRSMPDNATLWDEYKALYAQDLIEGTRNSMNFYEEHREAMDAGAIPTWQARYNEDEISAVQNAMNLYLVDPVAFMNEYQNEAADAALNCIKFVREELIENINNEPREYAHTTAFIDVHKRLLYYAVVDFGNDFSGRVVEYGAYPDQRARVFRMEDAYPTMMQEARTGDERLATLYCLRKLVKDLTCRYDLAALGIDHGYSVTADSVHSVCKDFPRTYASKGIFQGAKTQRPMSRFKSTATNRQGNHWALLTGKDQPCRNFIVDVNFWKSQLYNLFHSGKLLLSGGIDDNELLFRHLSAEKGVEVQANGNRVIEWTANKRGWTDNHLLDCLVGSAMLANFAGSRLNDEIVASKRRTFASF